MQEEKWLDKTLLAFSVLMRKTLEVLLIVDGETESLRYVDGLDVVLEGSWLFLNIYYCNSSKDSQAVSDSP